MSKVALISVSNKEGLLPILKSLSKKNYKIISTGGTAKFCSDNGIDVMQIKDYTKVEEMLDGRVKTLHHKIFAGVLHTNDSAHVKTISELDILSIDLAIINCYPFSNVIKDKDIEDLTAIENIDVGGPSLIRACAKNHNRVTILTDEKDYSAVQSFIDNEQQIPYELRRSLAAKAFSMLSTYDNNIAEYLDNNTQHNSNLRYGENPKQQATIRSGHNSAIKKLNGKELSFNNYLDADCALSLVTDFIEPTCVIVKHAMPCGVASSNEINNAYMSAFNSDPTSAFGGVIAFNYTVDDITANTILKNQFCELILAPSFTKDSIKILCTKKNLRVINFDADMIKKAKLTPTIKTTIFGTLEQSHLPAIDNQNLKVVSKKQPSNAQLDDLIFAWKISKYAKSNAIVYVKDQKSIGIGQGQCSRIASTEIGIQKAKQVGFSLKDSVMASDGFFPFADNITTAANSGVTAIIQPGGSIKDQEVIDTADEYDLVLIHTGVRQFRH